MVARGSASRGYKSVTSQAFSDFEFSDEPIDQDFAAADLCALQLIRFETFIHMVELQWDSE